MTYGWTGTNLEVDLTRSTIQKVRGDPAVVRAYLGGKGLNAKILWDRVPPEADPFSPDNLIIVGTGLLCGTPVPSANRTVITYRSPFTRAHSWSAFGGFFAPELKYAGYDNIIITGKSPKPVYLWIHDDKVELRNAAHLWGLGTHESQEAIRKELEDEKLQTIVIGPAGENRAYAASVEHSAGASASRGGVGAIWGDKKLKAIAVHGTKDIRVANPARLLELCNEILSRSDEKMKAAKVRPATIAGGLIGMALPGNFDYRSTIPLEAKQNWTSEAAVKMAKEVLGRNKLREVSCYNCQLACKWTFSSEDNIFASQKCNSFPNLMSAVKILDYDFGLKFYGLVEKLGFDSVSLAREVAFAIDLYQRGILTQEDTGGMHLEFGNPEVACTLAEKIARREGIGNILADGVYRAAQQIGRGAEKYAHHRRKMDAKPYDLQKRADLMLYTAVSDKGDLSRLEGTAQHGIVGKSREEREAYIKQGWLAPYPKEFEKYLLKDHEVHDNYEGLCQLTAYGEEIYALDDLLGICYFWSLFGPYSAFGSRTQIAELVSCATGMHIDETELTEIAQRTINIVRADLVRSGFSRKDDVLEDRFFEPVEEYPHHYDRASFNKWLDRFYELRGWDKEGVPTKETLEKLGLDYVWEELKQRGIVTEERAVTSAR